MHHAAFTVSILTRAFARVQLKRRVRFRVDLPVSILTRAFARVQLAFTLQESRG